MRRVSWLKAIWFCCLHTTDAEHLPEGCVSVLRKTIHHWRDTLKSPVHLACWGAVVVLFASRAQKIRKAYGGLLRATFDSTCHSRWGGIKHPRKILNRMLFRQVDLFLSACYFYQRFALPWPSLVAGGSLRVARSFWLRISGYIYGHVMGFDGIALALMGS